MRASRWRYPFQALIWGPGAVSTTLIAARGVPSSTHEQGGRSQQLAQIETEALLWAFLHL